MRTCPGRSAADQTGTRAHPAGKGKRGGAAVLVLLQRKDGEAVRRPIHLHANGHGRRDGTCAGVAIPPYEIHAIPTHGFRVGGDVNQVLAARHGTCPIMAAGMAVPGKKRRKNENERNLSVE